MPRKGAVTKRQLAPDSVVGSRLVQRFINKLTMAGKKSTAEHIFYGALARIQEGGGNSVDVFAQAVRNCMPLLEVRPRRVGGATYQVPVEVRADRQVSLALRWLVDAARERPERTMVERLANELAEAGGRQGVAVKRKDDMHRMAEANKAFAHYRW
jgi:small subunit ribosomal protein S7